MGQSRRVGTGRLTVDVFEFFQAVGFGAGVEDDCDCRGFTVGVFELLQGVACRAAVGRRGSSSLGLGLYMYMGVSSIVEFTRQTPGWWDLWGKVVYPRSRSGKYGGAERG